MANTLTILDYIVFGLLLLGSSFIGLYHGYKSRNTPQTTKEYLVASQSVSWFPLFVSLVASYLSAIALLGMPSEVYTYGVQYFVIILSYPIFVGLCVYLYAPIFRRIGVTSAFDYLEKRFSFGVRLMGSIMFIVEYVLYLAVVFYAPSLALKAVAGFPLPASLVSTAIVCNIYTAIGGMKGVIWTDVFQMGVMVSGLIVVIAIGSNEVGGIRNVFEIANKGGRLNLFNFDPDPTIRNTFWTLVFGGAFSAMPVYCVGQMQVQRFMAGKSWKDVRFALFMNIPGLFLVVSLCVLTGLVMYAVYAECDLREMKHVQSNDQILAYFLVNKLSNLKGVPGIFMASLFSGALSTASSGLNSLAAVTLEDIVKKIYPNLSEERMTTCTKIIAFSYGLLVLGCSFLVSKVGTMVLQIAYSIHGILGTPYLGIFAMGMLVPRASTFGAYVGGLFGFAVMMWLSIGAFIFPPDKGTLPVSISECSNSTNSTITYPHTPHEHPLAGVFSISYLWYAAIGTILTFVVGCIASLVSGGPDQPVAQELLFDYKKKLSLFYCEKRYRVNSMVLEEDRNEIELRTI